jgi:hypothetical protein
VSAFADLDWSRIDVTGIVTFGGLASIDVRRHQACLEWLIRQRYRIDTFDCRPGLSVAIPELGRLLCWEEQFGYVLGPNCRNLNALRDGFEFEIDEGGGRVFELIRADLAWQEDSPWLCGLLSIIQEECRRQLALGRRFFGLLVVPEGSKFIGAVIEQSMVPGLYSSPCHEVHEFAR